MRIVASAVLGIGLLGASLQQHERPLLVWNASSSVPIGFYLVLARHSRVGDYVLFGLSADIQHFAERRGYITRSTPLLKQIVAVEGQRVCRFGGLVTVRRQRVIVALQADRVGRPLPVWRGCRRLSSRKVFLLGSDLESFDSRYFGPVDRDRIIGAAIPIITRRKN